MIGKIGGGILALLRSHYVHGFIMLGVSLALYAASPPFLESLRYWNFDLYQQMQPREPDPEKMDAQVVIIDIDDESLEMFGQWPWPRNVLGNLIQNATAMGAGVVGFDVVFAEPDRMSPGVIAQTVPGLSEEAKEHLIQLPSNEEIFAGVIGKRPVVLGQVGINRETGLEDLPRKVGFAAMNGDPKPFLYHYPGVIRNLKELEDKAPGIGLFSVQPDADGTYRRVQLVARIAEQIYPALSLEMLRVALGSADDYLIKNWPDGGIKSVVIKTHAGGYEIPTDRQGRVWVHFAKYDIAPPMYISAKDILMGNMAVRPYLAGRLAIVGTSAIGLKDIRATPVNGNLPGVEIHAQVLETVLSKSYLTRPDGAVMAEIGLMVLGAVLMIVLVPRLNAAWTFLLATALVGGMIGYGWYEYTENRALVDAAYPSLVLFLHFVALSYLNYMREEKERAAVRDAFSHYVSPALLQELADNPDKLKLGGETKDITLLFSDIRGFTTISEQFDAEGLTRFINKFLTPMTNVILKHRGTIDKYMGDAIMAFWNAPLDVEEHPKHACRAALEMQQAVKDLNVALEEQAKEEGRKHIPIKVGAGLNTGDCCVGNMGSDQRFDYSALGDHVNLAARLEGQSKTYGVEIVIGDNTNRLLNDEFATIEIDSIMVKGKTEPVTIFALLGDETVRADATFEKIRAHNRTMLETYRSQQWDKAEAELKEIEALDPGLAGYCALYHGRIAEYRENPPPADWDGVFIATSK